tara:strand:- start:295 stop:516 length:222 start_codon:yes stop_codon:yes gene_type:complete
MMHFADHIIVETLTDDELDSLVATLHVLDHVMSSFEADLLNQAESELMARNDTIVIAGWDEDDEDLDVEWSTM